MPTVTVDLHADGDEEEPEQQILERLEVGLDLMAKLGFRQQQSSQQRAQRHRQPGRLRRRRHADGREQRGGDKDLSTVGGGYPAKQRAKQEPSHDQGRSKRQRRCEQCAGDARAERQRGRAERGDHEQDRHHHQVLHQQDREAGAPNRGGNLPPFAQQLQHERCG
jgi:hypothetical protein